MAAFHKQAEFKILFASADRLICPIQLKKNSFWGIGRSVVSTLVFAVSYPLYLGYLGLEVFGVWVMLMAVVAYLQLGSLNLPQAAAKFISESLVKKDATALCQYSSTLIGTIFGIGMVIMLLTYFSKEALSHLFKFPETLQPQIANLFFLTAVLTLQALVTETLGGMVSGAGRMDQVFQADILCRLVTLPLSLVLLHWHFNLLALFYGNIVGYLFYGVLMIVFTRRNLGFLPLSWRYMSWPQFCRMLRFTGPLFGGSLFSCLLQPFNRLLLGAMISPAAATIYDIADRASQVIRSHAEGGLRPLMPQISGLSAMAAEEEVRLLSLRAVQTILFWATPLFIMFYAAIDYVLPFWLHMKDIHDISINLHILLWGYYFNLLAVPFYYVFMGRGQANYCLYAHAIQSLLNLILGFLGLLAIRQIWVISLAASIGLIVSLILQMLLLLRSWGSVLYMVKKGLRSLSLPVVIFTPLLLFKGHMIYFVVLSSVVSILYILYLNYKHNTILQLK